MNIKHVFYLVGNVLMTVSPLPLLCILTILSSSESWADLKLLAFLIPALAMFVSGFGLSRGLRRFHSDTMKRRDGVGVTAFSWLAVCFFGAVPFLVHGATPAEAFFESVSGFTTTGSSIYSDIESLPDSILLWRSLTQWVGGLGILVFLVALLANLGIRGRSLVGAESSVNLGAAATSKVKDLVLQLLKVYLFLTVACFLALLFAGSFAHVEITLFEALLYTLATVSTGGFAPHNNSVAHFDSVAIESVLVVFMFVSGVSFVLLFKTFYEKNYKKKAGCTEAWTFLVIVVLIIAFVVTDLILQENINFLTALRQAVFPVVSMATSTGFGTVDYDLWPLMSKIFLAFLMIIGGCSGSTAGGLKVIRFVLLLQILRIEIQKTFRPNVVNVIRIDGGKIDSTALYRTLIYLVAVGFLIVVSSGVVSVMEPQVTDFETAIGAVLGTFFNMGPGFEAVGPTDNFHGFHSYTLLFLSWLMLLGRLEIFVLLALFSPALWKIR